MSLGERIRIARDAKGLKQSELAEMIEVKSAGVISNWEKDINKPDADKIIKLCEVLEISASYLLDYYGNTLNVSLEEQKHIKKYRALDEHGKDMVDTVLDKQYSRCAEEASRIKAYTANMAAGTGSEGLTEKKIKEMEAFGKLVSEYENKSE